MKNIIEINNVSKKYKNFALKNVTFNVPSGSIVGLVGENGAGKTTLIKSILNIVKLDEGDIKLFGKLNYDAIKEDIGVVLDNSFFAELLKVKDINFIMKNIYKNWDTELFEKYLQDFNIPSTEAIKTLSKGMRKKLEIATALSHHPKLLILDEPTTGLDPVIRNEILDIFLDFIQDENHSILLSSHITSDLEHIADYITFIHNGEIVLSKAKDDILNNYVVIRCDENTFNKLDKNDIVKYRQNKYNYDVLVADKNIAKKKYKDLIIDSVTIDEIMLLYIKGVK